MNKIPTSEEFLKNSQHIDYSKLIMPDELRGLLPINPFIEADLILFARMHVKAALEAAADKAMLKNIDSGLPVVKVVDRDSILNAYPEKNIK